MAKERFVVFSSLAGFKAGSDKYDNDSIVFVNDPQEPGIYTHTYGWITLPSNAAANQILSFVEGKAKWIDKDYYSKEEVDQAIEDVDVSDQLTEYAKTEDVESKIAQAKSEILGGAGQDYDTLKEIETWISTHQDLYQALVSAIAEKATKEEVEALKSEIEGTLEDYAKTEDVESKIAQAKQEIESAIEENDYASTEYVDGKVSELNTEIEKKADKDKVYTKEEVDAMWAWGEY